MQDFRKLHVWHSAHALTLAVYRATGEFPDTERFGLTSQLRRAAASIGANLAEGCGRSSSLDTRRCFRIALGSACELLNHLLLAHDLGLIDRKSMTALARQAFLVRRALIRLLDSMSPAATAARSAAENRRAARSAAK
jgi:four helix bundle protein